MHTQSNDRYLVCARRKEGKRGKDEVREGRPREIIEKVMWGSRERTFLFFSFMFVVV